MRKEIYQSEQHIFQHDRKSNVRYWFYGILIALGLFAFLPWTQNIRSRGLVTTLYQDQRPQEVNAIIGGQLIKWYVKEGDRVNAGDTLAQLGEVNVDYLDPALLERTAEQLEGKQQSVDLYRSKAQTADRQKNALETALPLKIEQLTNKLAQLQLKLQSDSAELQAAKNEWTIAKIQFDRQRALYDSGVVSLTQLEQRNQAYQAALAKRISAENKMVATQQELSITRIEMATQQQEYREKIAKTEGDRFSSLTELANGEVEIAKLNNQLASFNLRNKLYYIIAPQNGQIINASKAGIGEYVKPGDLILTIVPEKFVYAVELFVRPVDVPLISAGQKVRFLFDGFPAIVFSGWPGQSYGTFGGEVVAVERYNNKEGLFRVLIKEDPADRPWPQELQVGTGAMGIALLKDVPVWYEIWRNINGFPADYYKAKPNEKKS